MRRFFLTAAMGFASLAHADLLTMIPGTKTLEGVNVSKGATADISGQPLALTTAGAGLRTKKVMFDVKVYVTELLVADKTSFDLARTSASTALANLGEQKAVAIRLTFLRDVDAETVSSSFQEALDANQIDGKDSEINEFMKIVNSSGYVPQGGSLTLLITKKDDSTETLAYENLAGGNSAIKVHAFGAGFTKKVLSIWLGVPADLGLEKLQSDLLSGVN